MKKNRFPFILFILFIAADQGTKYFIEKTIPQGIQKELFASVFLTNIKNSNITLQEGFLDILFYIIIPSAVIIILLVTLFSKVNYSGIQRYMLWLLSAGGISNIIDRVVSADGVVDFIYIKRLTFLPVFNIADLTVALSAVIMLLSLIIQDRRNKRYE